MDEMQRCSALDFCTMTDPKLPSRLQHLQHHTNTGPVTSTDSHNGSQEGMKALLFVLVHDNVMLMASMCTAGET
jgi:hypothetical protein